MRARCASGQIDCALYRPWRVRRRGARSRVSRDSTGAPARGGSVLAEAASQQLDSRSGIRGGRRQARARMDRAAPAIAERPRARRAAEPALEQVLSRGAAGDCLRSGGQRRARLGWPRRRLRVARERARRLRGRHRLRVARRERQQGLAAPEVHARGEVPAADRPERAVEGQQRHCQSRKPGGYQRGQRGPGSLRGRRVPQPSRHRIRL